MHDERPAGAPDTGQTEKPALPPTIRAIELTKVFGSRTCVDRLTFEIGAGELYALLGDNGAGKTTTINMLTTLLSPTSGQVVICGFDALKRPERAKACFGVVSQDVAVYQELTAYENLSFVADLYGMPGGKAAERIASLLTQFGLADRADSPVGEFSMGMQRKLAIAIAILPEPQVIFMDEPTAGLDAMSRRHIWEILRELRAHGVTVLLTTHYLEEAEMLADRVGIIRQGRMVVEGTIAELRRRIGGIRAVAVTLSQRREEAEIRAALARAPEGLAAGSDFDQLRNRLVFSQPEGVSPGDYLEKVISWLAAEEITFGKLATSEPGLEDIYLSVSAMGRGG